MVYVVNGGRIEEVVCSDTDAVQWKVHVIDPWGCGEGSVSSERKECDIRKIPKCD